MSDYSQEDVEKMVENIDKYDDVNGDPNQEAAKENQVPNEEPQEKVASDFKFNTLEDLMKYELEYQAAGKPIKEDLSTILKRASQGYHYAQEMNKLKTERQQFETELLPQVEEAKTWREKYGKFEEYAKENPEWYDHWNKAWENRHTMQQQGDGSTVDQSQNIQAVIKDILMQELSPVKEFMQTQEQLKEQQKIEEQDSALFNAIDETRKAYSNIDFDSTNPDTGKSLQEDVMEFMYKTGIHDFQTAFKAFYSDNLIKMQVEQAREKEAQNEIERKKNGILDIRQGQPTRSRPIDHSRSNLDQLMQMAVNDPDIFPSR